ncbi:MAG: ABC transporter permease [Vicinamibacterales bacterium]
MNIWTRIFRAFTSLSPRFRREYGEDAARDYTKLVAREDRRKGRVASAWIAVLGALDALKVTTLDRASEVSLVPRSVGPDLRQALRMYRREPLLALAVAATLALAIGATTAAYSVVYDVLLAPLSYREPDRLVAIFQRTVRGDNYYASLADVQDFNRDIKAFAHVGGVRRSSFIWLADDEARPVVAALVTPRLFSNLGVRFAAGGDFAENDPDAVIVSAGFARRHFGSPSGAMGRVLRHEQGQYRIAGVLADRVALREAREVFIPYKPGPREIALRGPGALFAIGRLAPGATREQAEAEASALKRGLAATHPNEKETQGARVVDLRENLVDDLSQQMWSVFGAVGAVLLVALMSVVSLLLARAAARAGDAAIRLSLGASRSRLSRLWMLEALALAVPGAAGGIALAHLLLGTIRATLPPGPNPYGTLQVNWAALLFAAGLLALAVLALSMAPRLVGLARPQMGALRDAARSVAGLRRARWQSWLIAGQVALSLVLVASAMWLGTSLRRLEGTRLGFDPERVVSVSFSLSRTAYPRPAAQALAARLEQLAGSHPAVEAAAVANQPPGRRTSRFILARVKPGAPRFPPDEEHATVDYSVSLGFFDVMKIPVLAGRTFTGSDNPASVVVVSRSFAQKYLPTGAVGQQVQILGPPQEVIGVVDDVQADALGQPIDPHFYTPLAGASLGYPSTLLLKLRRGASLDGGDIRAMIRGIDPAIPVRIETLQDVIGIAVVPRKIATTAAIGFALGALLLAAINIYALAAFTVVQRHREIGIRLALGAGRREAVRVIIRRGLIWVAGGAVAGAAAAFLLVGPLIASLLYQTTTNEILPALLTMGAVAATAGIALYLPARRAASIDPAITLRAE